MDTATADTPAATASPHEATSAGTNAVPVGRLVSPETGSAYTAPKTPDELIDAFVQGYDFFTREQMIAAIDEGMFEIYKLTPGAYALVEFVETRYGKTMNILTVAGSRDQWAPGWVSIEKIARKNQCSLIYSVGHQGWRRFMEARGFVTSPMLKMVKEVIYDSVP